ncbi:transposable element Tcb1 transposase [Trichonephila clavipes]|nr:transposable element Tcb1 transposase [Trichonephila clavipes]
MNLKPRYVLICSLPNPCTIRGHDINTTAVTHGRAGKIGSRVGRNQITAMRICDRWMQEGTIDRRGLSHPPQCTTSRREDRQIVRMAVTDRSVTSRTIAQHIETVTHHSVSARTIRSRLQQSVVCPQDVHCLVYH